MKNPKNLLYLASILLITASIYFLFLKNNENEVETVQVIKKDIVNEIFESGSTKKGNDVKLGFKEGGRIEKFTIEEGVKVNRGEIIAELEKKELIISLKEAEANLSSAKASLESLLSGATKEELGTYESSVETAESNLLSAENNLKKQKKVTQETLKEIYQNTPILLGDVHSLISKAELDILDITRKYFVGFIVPETTSGIRSRDSIRESAKEIKNYRDFVNKENVTFSEKGDALNKIESELKNILLELSNLIDIIHSDFYENKFTASEKDLFRQYRSETNEILNKVISLIGRKSLAKAETDLKISSAQESVISAKNNLNQAEKELSRIKADPKSTDIRIKEAVINQAESRIEILNEKIKDSTLKSPVNGITSSVLASVGEIVSAGTSVIVITPEKDIAISLDIYEGDISKVNTGDRVFASFVAFPNKEFTGGVVFINPSGKEVSGVIYYEIEIILESYPENVLPQMTVDVTIETDRRENVLTIPETAVHEENGKKYVYLLKNNQKEKREIELGLRGERRTVEVLSGLNEHDVILID